MENQVFQNLNEQTTLPGCYCCQ